MPRSEEGQERERQRKRQYNRDQYAAAKLFWQNFIARKDEYDTICCVECHQPETEPDNPLHFSHNNPLTKSFDLSLAIKGVLRKTHAEIEAEARKCSLRHRRCHSTFDNGTVYGLDGIPHGLSGYRYGCRCEKCVADYREYDRDNKRERRANDLALREVQNKYQRDLRARKKAAKLATS
jgi:hypothetical protein